MNCPTCKSLLLHRHEPPPEADRCTSAACGRVFDTLGAESASDPGPWPAQNVMDHLEGLQGSHAEHDEHGKIVASWSYQRGTSATVS